MVPVWDISIFVERNTEKVETEVGGLGEAEVPGDEQACGLRDVDIGNKAFTTLY